MKGIILAGGSGSRLYPATLAINKQLIPIYDKPMIFYPLSVLMLAGIREIQLISAPEYVNTYRRLLGSGERWGLSISYAIQPSPEGLAQAFLISADFIADQPVALVLGDNLFFGASLVDLLVRARSRTRGATVFAYEVDDPERYGVIELDAAGRPLGIVEKPTAPRSRHAVTGLYFYDPRVVSLAAKLRRSARGEYEITDINRAYLEAGELFVERLSRGFAWLDTGTHDSLLEASQFVRTIQHRQGTQIACLEEIAYLKGYISREELIRAGECYGKTRYGTYLTRLAESSTGEL